MGLQLNMRMKIAKLSSNCSVSRICTHGASRQNAKRDRGADKYVDEYHGAKLYNNGPE